MKKWEVKFKVKNSKLKVEKIIKVLLENRGIKSEKERDRFLSPKLEDATVESVEIDKIQLKKALKRIKEAIEKKEKIIVFGDYDCDGICATAILWETLNDLGADVMPYIPHRQDEGYGLSLKGISNIQCQISNVKLIITVDNGIVANEAVEFAKKEGIDVIITDHHIPSKKLPNACSIIHSTKVCGAGVAYLLAQEIRVVILNEVKNLKTSLQAGRGSFANAQDDIQKNNHLELVAIATIGDLVPLTNENRIFVRHGIEMLKNTKRIGLRAIFEEARIDPKNLGVYEIGHIIAPRINAMGRIDFAMESLRLLCTKDRLRAKVLADKIGRTNRERQDLTDKTFEHAKYQISNIKFPMSNLLFVGHNTYQQGVIGLVAGKLVEEYYRPAIVVSEGEIYSKASARSVRGFNIIEFIRGASEYLVDAGGHPMAAGFTIKTSDLLKLQAYFEKEAEKVIDGDVLKRTLRIDMELPCELIGIELFDAIQKLSPFGIGNPEPVFLTRNVEIREVRTVGIEGKHLKLSLCHPELVSGSSSKGVEMPKQVRHDMKMDGIGFGLGKRASEIKIGDKIDIVYTIDKDDWLARRLASLRERSGSLGEGGNGNEKIQLKVKDFKIF